MKTIDVTLDAALHERALRLAAERGQDLGELIQTLLARETAPRNIELRTWGDGETNPDRFSLYDRLTGRWSHAPARNPFRDS